MKAALLLLVALLAAGCLGGTSPPPPSGPATHVTDCLRAGDSETCSRPTDRSPLSVAVLPGGNRSRIALGIRNDGTGPLAFDADPPPYWFYRRDDGRWQRVGQGAGGPADGLALGPGQDLTVVLSYGRFDNATRSRDIAYGDPFEEAPWPAGTYRACFSAHPGNATAWVRGCEDFRAR